MAMKSQNSKHHYFIAENHDSSDYFEFACYYGSKQFKFTSCDDVFSKNEIDLGSKILVDTILKDATNYSGKILDMCCGYGAIGVLLSEYLEATFDMCDINTLALDLCKINTKNNGSRVDKIFSSDIWENVDCKYNHIVSNPPIKVGKKVLIDFINNAPKYLEQNGTLTIVIKKNLGADSTKKYLTEIFGNCEVLEREKGYYILQSKKI